MTPGTASSDEPAPAGELGLDGLLAWSQARFVTRTAATPLDPVPARLDEAHGSLLARALVSPYDEPVADAAAVDGYAVCGEGPWRVGDLAPDVALAPHTAVRVRAKQILPGHTDAVVSTEQGVLDGDGVYLTARDPLTNLPEATARPDLGVGIIRQAAIRSAGTELLAAHSPITAGTLALAAAAGADSLDIIPPPVVGTLILGASLLTSGPPREGRVRDALGATIPAFLGSLGARAHPPVRAPQTRDLLIAEINDSNANLLITTGSTSPSGDNLLRETLRDLGAHWLIDGILMTPGAQTLLVRLPDDRLLLGLPGHPGAALAGLVTLAAPLIAGLRGELRDPARTSASGVPPRARLSSEPPSPEYEQDTIVTPVRLVNDRRDSPLSSAQPLDQDGPADLGGWANADAIAVIPPGSGAVGDVVELLDPWGRPAGTP